jgi:hypothetical protein
MLMPRGAYVEYAVLPAHSAFIIPENIGFEGSLILSWLPPHPTPSYEKPAVVTLSDLPNRSLHDPLHDPKQ